MPHDIVKAHSPKRVVVVGARPADLRPRAWRAGAPGHGAGGVGPGGWAGERPCRQSAPEGDDRHHRLAARRAGASGGRGPLQHLRGGRGRPGAGTGGRGDRDRGASAGARDGRRKPDDLKLGHHHRRGQGSGPCAGLRRRRCPCRHDGGRGRGAGRGRSGACHARTLLRSRHGRDEPCALHARLPRNRNEGDDQHAPVGRPARRQRTCRDLRVGLRTRLVGGTAR